VRLVPDNEDYRALGELISSVESWTEDDADLARRLLASQSEAIAAVHPKDETRRASMTAVGEKLREALATWNAKR
jgi:hypothetical protein